MKSIKREREIYEGTFERLAESNKSDEHDDWFQISEFMRPAKRMLTKLERSKFKNIKHNLLIEWISSPFLDDLVSGRPPVLSIIRTGKLNLFHKYFNVKDFEDEILDQCEEEAVENDHMSYDNVETMVRLEYLLAAFKRPNDDMIEFVIKELQLTDEELSYLTDIFDEHPKEVMNLLKSSYFIIKNQISISNLCISSVAELIELESICPNLYKEITLYEMLNRVSQEVLDYIVVKFNLRTQLRELAAQEWPLYNRDLMYYVLNFENPRETYIQWLDNVIEEFNITKKSIHLGFRVGFKLTDRLEQFNESAFVILMRKYINENRPLMIDFIIKHCPEADLTINNYEYFHRSIQFHKKIINQSILIPPAATIGYNEDFEYYRVITQYNIDRVNLIEFIIRLIPVSQTMIYPRQIAMFLINRYVIKKEELLPYTDDIVTRVLINLIYNLTNREF